MLANNVNMEVTGSNQMGGVSCMTKLAKLLPLIIKQFEVSDN